MKHPTRVVHSNLQSDSLKESGMTFYHGTPGDRVLCGQAGNAVNAVILTKGTLEQGIVSALFIHTFWYRSLKEEHHSVTVEERCRDSSVPLSQNIHEPWNKNWPITQLAE